MRKPKNFPNHKICPESMSNVSNLTGSCQIDEAISQSTSRGLLEKVNQHIVTPGAYVLQKPTDMYPRVIG